MPQIPAYNYGAPTIPQIPTYGASKYDSAGPQVFPVRWNMSLALRFRTADGTEGTLSPALGLLHELAHVERAIRDPKGAKADSDLKSFRNKLYDAFTSWGTPEERRAIREVEQRVAQSLGEGIRPNHLGDPYLVFNDVTSRKYFAPFPRTPPPDQPAK